MAIVNTMWLSGTSKKLGGTVLYQAMGQTRQRELAASVTNPRTTSQMTQRVKWANLVNFYRVNASWMKYAFETKKTNQSEYNKFMSLNVTSNGIYLTKQAAAAGASVVSNYIMTQGSLPSISYNRQGNDILTNIYLQDVSNLDENSTVAELSEQILLANPGILEGDQLSIIRFTQMANEVTGYPYVIVRKYELIVSRTNIDLWTNYWPYEIVGWADNGQGNVIIIEPTGNAGGLLMALSRTVGGKTYVSTQSILPVDNEATIAAWSGASALQAAINSYGESEDAFLTSTAANYAENEPISLVPLSVTIAGETTASGGILGRIGLYDGERMAINFNAPFTGSVTYVYIDTTASTGGTATMSNISVSGNSVIVPAIDKGTVPENAIIRSIRIVTSENTYEIKFATGGSLE